ncbi:MAG TPA: pyridoxal 5'-phosphate synthase glutaminase subunit PdxT [Magnetospirillaceae bacterium]|nr:pyridoxal 5'-phosphate synthase glutaminase subunit PdxT [Magnetospirillaceae bacterium]
MDIGVLALQGAVQEHERVLARLGARTRQVRLPADLEGLAGIVLPGGESTVMARYLREYRLDLALRERAQTGLAFFGVCAGAILLCREVDGEPGVLGLLPARAQRNAYGRQMNSFVALANGPAGTFHGLFIRSPKLEPLEGTEVLASLPDGQPVMLRWGKVLAAAFHPELAGDDRAHSLFLKSAWG